MRRVVLLALLALALPTAALADTIDYGNLGSVGGGTAIISGSATAGSTYTLTSQLVSVLNVNTHALSLGTLGWVTVTTGTLSACPAGLCFSGGTLTITSAGGATLFSGSFTGGTVMTTSGTTWVNASLGSAGGSGQISFGVGRLGTVSGDTVVTPEPGTLGLLGTGLVGLAGLVRRKLRA
ncbi:MAG: hypothetical protein DMG93_19410 [Acidobacteria bacterium]|nr:MAG: hypothetical protein DMG93_19410 [Acidobacteriota bacterium]